MAKSPTTRSRMVKSPTAVNHLARSPLGRSPLGRSPLVKKPSTRSRRGPTTEQNSKLETTPTDRRTPARTGRIQIETAKIGLSTTGPSRADANPSTPANLNTVAITLGKPMGPSTRTGLRVPNDQEKAVRTEPGNPIPRRSTRAVAGPRMALRTPSLEVNSNQNDATGIDRHSHLGRRSEPNIEAPGRRVPASPPRRIENGHRTRAVVENSSPREAPQASQVGSVRDVARAPGPAESMPVPAPRDNNREPAQAGVNPSVAGVHVRAAALIASEPPSPDLANQIAPVQQADAQTLNHIGAYHG